MPFTSKSDVLRGNVSAITKNDVSIVTQRQAITAVAADIALNAVGALAILPAGCIPVGVYVDGEGSLACDIGIVNDAETAISTAAADGGAAWVTATAANGNTILTTKTIVRVAPSNVDRKVGLRVTTAGAVGTLGLTLQYRQA